MLAVTEKGTLITIELTRNDLIHLLNGEIAACEALIEDDEVVVLRVCMGRNEEDEDEEE